MSRSQFAFENCVVVHLVGLVPITYYKLLLQNARRVVVDNGSEREKAEFEFK